MINQQVKMQYSILDSIPEPVQYKTFTDRYFSKRYILGVDSIENNDYTLLFHSNRICLLSLAPSHYFFKKNSDYKINFSAGKVDRLTNSVKGKGKKGGQTLLPQSIVCKVEYEDGTSFEIPACMKGTLVEVNEELVEKPELLKQFPDSNGYIAVILSSIAKSEETKNELMSEEGYAQVMNTAPLEI